MCKIYFFKINLNSHIINDDILEKYEKDFSNLTLNELYVSLCTKHHCGNFLENMLINQFQNLIILKIQMPRFMPNFINFKFPKLKEFSFTWKRSSLIIGSNFFLILWVTLIYEI